MALTVTTLVTSTQDGVIALLVPFVSGTFNVAAGSRLVLTDSFESDPSNVPTITWTGGTPAGATAWTQRVNGTYQDGVGDTQAVLIWTADVTTALTTVSVTHTNSVSIVNGIVLQLVVRQVTGGSLSSGFGATAIAATTSASRVINVSITATGAASLLIGAVGTANASTALTPSGTTTSDSSSSLPTAGASYLSCHATALTAGAGSVTFGATNTNTFTVGAAIELLANAFENDEWIPPRPIADDLLVVVYA